MVPSRWYVIDPGSHVRLINQFAAAQNTQVAYQGILTHCIMLRGIQCQDACIVVDIKWLGRYGRPVDYENKTPGWQEMKLILNSSLKKMLFGVTEPQNKPLRKMQPFHHPRQNNLFSLPENIAGCSTEVGAEGRGGCQREPVERRAPIGCRSPV